MPSFSRARESRPLRYLLSGGVAAASHLGTLFVLVHFFGVWYLAAATIGFCIGIVVSFVLQKFFTFGDHSRATIVRQGGLHIGLQLFNLCTNTALMYVGVSILHVPYLLAQFVIGLGIACYNFFFYRRFVFVKTPQGISHLYKKYIPLLFLTGTALLGTIVPAVLVIHEAGGLSAWQGVPPRGATDSLYYYARIREVADGHPFIGNPYAYEHRGALAPAFFLPDILTALPLLAGVPFTLTILLNIFIWGFLFLILAYALLRALAMPRWWAVLWSLVAYLSSYTFLLRPTIMQTVYGALLLFLYALIRFLYEPQSRRRGLYLALAATLTFYIYTFLAYVVLMSLATVFVAYLISRRFAAVRALCIVALWSALLLIPFGIYAFLQMQDPNYFATLVRIGLTYTHLPTIDAYNYGRWMVGVIAVFGTLLWLHYRAEAEDRARDLFWVATGVGALLALLLNVGTGIDLTLPVHVGRIAIPWQPLALSAGLLEWGRLWSATQRARTPYVVIGILLVILTLGTAAAVGRGLGIFAFNARGETVREEQAYAPPLAWLEKNVPGQSVVWANESLSMYIPIQTRHYPLFSHAAVLHSMSDDELVERYLLSRSLEKGFSEDELKRDFTLYAGVGPQKYQAIALNEQASLCNLLRHVDTARTCPPYTDGISMKGDAYFTDLMKRFREVQKVRPALLAKYHVAYLLVDRTNDTWQGVPFAKAVYDDGRFAIIPITALP